MCGLAGLINRDCDLDALGLAERAHAMASVLAHRGPDGAGVWVDATSGYAIGHRRLAIIDTTEAGAQPMHSASGRYVIGFNGELYNFQELRDELDTAQACPNAWRGHSDTEVALAAIEHWGVVRALQRFEGMFAIALWDRATQTLHLARDRFGEKPLYYGWGGGAFLFASELKGFREHREWRREIDRGAVALLMRYGYVPAPRSIYAGLSKLLPGSVLSIAVADVRSGVVPAPLVFWNPLDEAAAARTEGFRGDFTDAVDELERLLLRSVSRQMVADRPVGAFLSGGIDSSLIVALMQRASGQPVKTFSVGYIEGKYDERGFATTVARHLGTEHVNCELSPRDMIAAIPSLPALVDEPLADASLIPTWAIARVARAKVAVCLSGDGGDELFGGYERYFVARRIARMLGGFPRGSRKRLARALRAVGGSDWLARLQRTRLPVPGGYGEQLTSDLLEKLGEVIDFDNDVALCRNLVSHWRGTDPIVLDVEEPRDIFDSARSWLPSGSLVDRFMLIDCLSSLPDNNLAKVDRATMAVGLECRAPFLDLGVFSLTWRVPPGWRADHASPKRLLREVLARHVPPTLTGRRKMGFSVPVDEWLRGELREWSEDLLSETALRDAGFLDVAAVRRKWQEHLSGRRNWQYALWDVLSLQSWLAEERRQASRPMPLRPEVGPGLWMTAPIGCQAS
jgi:asparagine synthase (glutamine-hydrolysing)